MPDPDDATSLQDWLWVEEGAQGRQTIEFTPTLHIFRDLGAQRKVNGRNTVPVIRIGNEDPMNSMNVTLSVRMLMLIR